MARVLDVPTTSGSTLRAEYTDFLNDPTTRILVVQGPSDSGKTTVWRQMRSSMAGNQLRTRYFDLEEWTLKLRDVEGSDGVVVIDHLDRTSAVSTLRAGHAVFVRWVPAFLDSGARVVLLINSQWAGQYREAYGASVLVTLRHSNPDTPTNVVTPRAYTLTELLRLPGVSNIPVEMFEDEGLRLPGLISLACEVAQEAEPIHMEHDAAIDISLAQALRWINQPTLDHSRRVREALWLYFGSREVEWCEPSVSISEIYRGLAGEFNSGDIRQNGHGPFESTDHGLRLRSSSLRLAAGGWFLKHVVESDIVPHVRHPISRKLVDSATQILSTDRLRGLAAVVAKLDAFRGQRLSNHQQLLACAIATVAVQLADGAEIDLSDLDLSIGDHGAAVPIPIEVRDLVRARLTRHLAEHSGTLFSILSSLPLSTMSAYEGDSTLWRAVRSWAASLFAQYAIDTEVIVSSPNFSDLWRYEDILDDSVTGSTTQFMSDQDAALREVLSRFRGYIQACLADIWDGINDGVWDSISRMREEKVDALIVRGTGHDATLNLAGSKLQRSRLGNANVARWTFRGADLFLCDLRSCDGLESAELTESNWWDAILPPHVRYRLSRLEQADGFALWCERPPWSNPYYTGLWPVPLETEGAT